MSEQYSREILRRNVAQICQTIGWNGINSTPLDILVHVLEKYILTLGTQANRYAEQFNRTEPNLNDLALVFRDLHIQLPELAEYTRCVPSVPPPLCADKFPVPKESFLNFLKPGSHEVVTRPVHVHEHLPPMYPEKEQDTPAVAGTVEIRQNGTENEENNAICVETTVAESLDKPKDPFKRPIDPISMPSKRPRLRLDEEERTREISSVMMTMSGFLSPAREGKLPEARPPVIVSEKHDKHKTLSHHSAAKISSVEKGDKKSKKNKLLNGKIMKSKRKDKTHKGDSGKHKDSNKSSKYPPGYLMKTKDVHHSHNHMPIPAPKATVSPRAAMGPPPVPTPEVIRPIVKQEPVDKQPSPIPSTVPSPSQFVKNLPVTEETIPVPRKIPISKSPLIPNIISSNKNPSPSLVTTNVEIKKECVEEEEKLASQPDRSKINIFKRISNKSKEDKSSSEVVPEKSTVAHSTKSQENTYGNSTQSISENVRVKTEDSYVNNNNSNAVDLSKEMDLRAHEVIDVDDDSLDRNPQVTKKPTSAEHPNLPVNLQITSSKDLPSSSPKIKKEKKHKDKKDKAAKLQAKLLKKQQQVLAMEMAEAEKQMKLASAKPPKSSRPKSESKIPPMHPGFPFFPVMSAGRNMMPGPGLIPNPGLIPGTDFLANFANNPALRGLPTSNLLTNPFAMNAGGPGLIPSGTAFMPDTMTSSQLQMHLGNFPHTSRSPSSVKIPPLLRRPSLEVIPVENDDDRGYKSLGRDKDRHDKHKPMTIPNILQKHKSKYKDNKMNTYKMPPVQPDITIELNPPKMEPIRQPEPIKEPLALPPRPPTPPPEPTPPPPVPAPAPTKLTPEPPIEKTLDGVEKKKDKSHKKIKKDKEGKIKKKKDKKDKDKSKEKDKSEKKKIKEEKHELKEKIKKEKKEKKKEKSLEKADGLVPKLTLKLGSSNSNSPMPPSSPDVFKLNIKPVVKKDETEDTSTKEEAASREHSRSPELAQISALVTRPPKQKHSKHNHVSEAETPSSPPSTGEATRKNRPPSSYSKYKRILFKPLSKKGHFEDETGAISEEISTPSPAKSIDKVAGPLPTPYYVDEHGNKIWVCPACGRPDNGSPMIGCDGCDGWYHWVCVGITEEPGATEDWFCKSCLAKRTAMELAGVTTSGKKRGRKPKAEKIRDCH